MNIRNFAGIISTAALTAGCNCKSKPIIAKEAAIAVQPIINVFPAAEKAIKLSSKKEVQEAGDEFISELAESIAYKNKKEGMDFTKYRKINLIAENEPFIVVEKRDAYTLNTKKKAVSVNDATLDEISEAANLYCKNTLEGACPNNYLGVSSVFSDVRKDSRTEAYYIGIDCYANRSNGYKIINVNGEELSR